MGNTHDNIAREKAGIIKNRVPVVIGDRDIRTQEVFIENVGQPTLACIRPAVDALQELDMHRKVQLIISYYLIFALLFHDE